jgi:hypothetical protein
MDINYGNAGVASFDTGSIETTELLNAAIPVIVTESFDVDGAVDWPAFKVVGRDPVSGKLVEPTAVIPAVGITVGPVKLAAGTNKVPVFRAGHFNVDKLVYPANALFDTDAEKIAAFRLQPEGTQIIVSKRV